MEIKRDYFKKRDTRLRKVKEYGLAMGPENPLRMTGRSLGKIFWYIGQAMRFPQTDITVQDHLPMDSCARYTFNRLRKLVDDLGIQGFSYDMAEMKIKYDYRTPSEILAEKRGGG